MLFFCSKCGAARVCCTFGELCSASAARRGLEGCVQASSFGPEMRCDCKVFAGALGVQVGIWFRWRGVLRPLPISADLTAASIFPPLDDTRKAEFCVAAAIAAKHTKVTRF